MTQTAQTAQPRTAAAPAQRTRATLASDESFEISTVLADGQQARIRTTGALTPAASALLISVLRAHLRAGRRDLRVDIGKSAVVDPAVLPALTDLHHRVAACGGALVLENAESRVVDTIRNLDLLVAAEPAH